jgi:TolB-like protein/Flp pilus assembly protein TadD
VTESSRAVFLSYASQDAVAAERICKALRAAGIEVWFDQSELRGGDAWDQSIRRELHDCALFIPVISANTAARHEGYFRLEWDLADQRTHMIARNRAFIVPVCVDATAETGADTPESFQRVQWTRLPGGETSAAFVERLQRLLTGEAGLTPERAHSASAVASLPRHGRHRTVLFGLITAAALLASGYLGFERLNRANPTAIPSAASIAVLPLANESGETSQQYFSDGISEDLITALSQIPGLKVIGRSSAFKFRDSKEDSRSIGAQLGVARLLEGSVRRAGETVRVSAELIDTADGSTLWSQRYDRPYQDLFALQDEITHAVAGALKTKLLPDERAAAQSDRPPGGSLEAYNAWLQGNFYQRRISEAGFRKAIEYYLAATQIDPRYARAWSSLAVAYVDLGVFSNGAAAQEANAKAHEAADRALALAPDSAAAHRAKGAVLMYADFDWRGSEAEVRRALALSPNDGDTKVTLGIVVAILGESGQAVDLTQQALATDPLRADWYRNLAEDLLALGRLDEAGRAIRRTIELQPGGQGNYLLLSGIEVLRGDAQEALVTAQQEPPGPSREAAVALARQIGNDRAAADAALKALIDKYADVTPYSIAEVYAIRNDPDKTFEWLEHARHTHDLGVTNLLGDPLILRFKDDPRFAAFCQKVGLPAPGEGRAGGS